MLRGNCCTNGQACNRQNGSRSGPAVATPVVAMMSVVAAVALPPVGLS